MPDSGNYLISFRVGLPAKVVRGSDTVKAKFAASMLYQEKFKALNRADNVPAILNQA